jgi:hypothetical protein
VSVRSEEGKAMKGTSLVPVVLAVVTLLIPGLVFSDSHFIQINPGTLVPLGGSVGLVSSYVTLKAAYVVGEAVAITIQSDGNCQQAELSWGDFLSHIPVLTLNLKDKTSETYTHTYTSPGVKTVRVVGTVGCVGMAATHVVVVPESPGPDLSSSPQVSKVHGPSLFSEVLPYGVLPDHGLGLQHPARRGAHVRDLPPRMVAGPPKPLPWTVGTHSRLAQHLLLVASG